MKFHALLALLLTGLINTSAAGAADDAALEAEARELVASFVGRLKP